MIDEISGIAFINESGNVDAYMNVDGESMLLSDMQNIGMVENCGWLSKLVKGAAGTAVAAAVIVATGGLAAGAVVTATTAVAAVDVVEKVNAVNNKKHNAKNAEPTGYINGQAKYSNWKFGTKTLDYNGCGVIATYNALRKLGKTEKLVDLIYNFDMKNGTMAMGFFGSDPTHISQYLRDKGLSCTSYSTFSSLQTALSKMKTSQVLILCSWNGEKVENGAHYFAVEKTSSGTYKAYNRYDNSTSYTTYTKIDKSVTGGDLIVAYIVG